ncbi:heavy metal translocating P-type ATPase [Pygmaiobacter massiliensis]|uniref:heavy metal translocating P-type ATPase n=1 Tax=Pygmaiobacter massiliensis TaxID=1917873 RepID=UPI0028A0946C|nr:heavy metal translocating P-type ATPase [Pygmaiobacter massiliensis]
MDANKKRLIRIIIGAVLFAIAVLLNLNNFAVELGLFLASFIIIGGDVVIKALKNISHGQVFDENFLMCIATIGAFIIGEYPEGVAVMLFYQVGELFQTYAVDKSRKSIASLMDIRPDYANVQRNGQLEKVDPDEVAIGDIIVVRPGEKIPLDAIVLEGSSMIDTKALTGESVPREASVGDTLLSGCINMSGLLTAKVTKEFGESTVSKILDLVENASTKKSNSENFITKFARYYTPVVVIVAALLAIIPPLVIPGATFSDWVYRALTFLVISCPCALVISVPLSFFGGIGAASINGVLIKGSNYLEALAQAETIVFDKTGTLTKGVFKVQNIFPNGISEEELLRLTAYAESYSNHPISLSLKEAFGQEIDTSLISDVEEIAGHGVIAMVDGKQVAAGNNKMVKRFGLPDVDIGDAVGTIVHVIVDQEYRGYIVIADEVKDDAPQAIALLKKEQVRQTVMLTGDAKAIGEKVAKQLGLDQVYTELLPGDKVDKVEELMRQKSSNGKLVFVGDGINDAPVLARADLGIAMGGLGSDAAIEAADIVIMTDEPSKISTAMKISRKTLGIVRQNIVFSLIVKFAVLILGAMGIATMWAAVFADVGVSVIAILNAVRILNAKQYR